MLQPPKGKKKKANGSSSYGQISSSQEQRAQKTNTAAKNFLSKAGKVAVDIAVESSGLGLGKRVLGAVKNMASSGRTSKRARVKELPKSVSIRSKESVPSKSGTKIKPKYKKVEEAMRRANPGSASTRANRIYETVINPGSAPTSPKGRIGNRMDRTVNEIKPTGLSPLNGNAFTGAMAKTGGDYNKAKALLGDSPMDYGTGSPFQLRKEKLSGAERRNQKEGIDTSTPENKKRFQEYKASGGKLTTTQAARIGYATPKQSRSRKSTYAQDYGRGNNS